MIIGEKLKVRRKKAGFTQEQVAEKMNITRQTLSNWEMGKNYPDIESIIKLSQLYQLSLDELLLGKIYFKGALAMGKKSSEVEIKAMIHKHYPSATNIKELSGGLASQTYAFEANGKHYVFQIGNHLAAYEKEKWVHKTFGNHLPVRNVLEVQVTQDQLAYSISEFIAGSKLFDLNSQQLLDIVPAVMGVLGDLEAIDVSDATGYGRYDGSGHASYPSWIDFIEAIYNENIYNWSTLEQKGLDSGIVKSAIAELKAHIGSVTLSGKYLVHGDLGSYNLLAEDDQITGIIDWSYSLYGDHLYDKANILFWNEDKLQPLIQQITNKYITTLETKEKMYCYMLRIGLEEIYNTVILNEVGYDIEWVANRVQKIMDSFL